MLSTRIIRRKIRSVRNIKKITEAMKMVAASKLRRVQNQVAASRPFAEKMGGILRRLAPHAEGVEHPLLEVRTPPQRIGAVVISSDKGLCGSYNTNILRRAVEFAAAQSVPVEFIVVGRKGRDFLRRRNYSIVRSFVGLSAESPLSDILELARYLRELYESAQVDALNLVYTEFINPMVQRPRVLPFLPFQPAEAEPGTGAAAEYIFEPGPGPLLMSLIPRYIDTQVYQIILEASASEQGARMVAMSNAASNAEDLITQLTLSYNKARQATITSELIDVVTGASALSA